MHYFSGKGCFEFLESMHYCIGILIYDTIRDNFPKYVVSLYEFDMSRNGIKHRNIRDFLLAEEWN